MAEMVAKIKIMTEVIFFSSHLDSKAKLKLPVFRLDFTVQNPSINWDPVSLNEVDTCETHQLNLSI